MTSICIYKELFPSGVFNPYLISPHTTSFSTRRRRGSQSFQLPIRPPCALGMRNAFSQPKKGAAQDKKDRSPPPLLACLPAYLPACCLLPDASKSHPTKKEEPPSNKKKKPVLLRPKSEWCPSLLIFPFFVNKKRLKRGKKKRPAKMGWRT